MSAYIIRRLLLTIPTLLVLSILVFLSVRFIPGDVIDAMFGDMQYLGGGVDREAFERMLGLGLLLLLTIMSIAGRGLVQIIVVLGVSAGISNSRVVRSAVIGIKENDYSEIKR